MKIDHIGLVNNSEEAAVRFYREVLGLEKTRESTVAPELSLQLFSLPREIRMLVFEREGVKIEVFIIETERPVTNIHHFCLAVHDFPEFMTRAREAGARIITAERGDKVVYFIEDFSGNLIEIKAV